MRFDAFSNYIAGLKDFDPIKHVSKYKGGHCLTLAWVYAIRHKARVIGILKDDLPVYHHFLNIYGNELYDPSSRFNVPLVVGKEFEFRGQSYMTKKVVDLGDKGSIILSRLGKKDFTIDWVGIPNDDLMFHMKDIHVTRRNIVLRTYFEHINVTYLWKENSISIKIGDNTYAYNINESIPSSIISKVKKVTDINLEDYLSKFFSAYHKVKWRYIDPY